MNKVFNSVICCKKKKKSQHCISFSHVLTDNLMFCCMLCTSIIAVISFVSVITGWCRTLMTSLCICFSASSGSDSPDQALEAEEIVKQLEMEQPVETPTSTATSTQEVCATTNFYSSVSQLPPLRPPYIPEVSPAVVEGGLEADPDLPPLTGRWRGWEHVVGKHQVSCVGDSCWLCFYC